jgi:hypothetical protein
MRGVSKQNTIKRARLKLIKFSHFRTKRHEVRDRRLATKAKLKGGQIQNRAQEDLIRNIGANSIGPKASRGPMLIEHHPSHLN